jgi:hypothetical protein
VIARTSGLSYHFLEDTPVGRMYADGKLLDPRVPLAEAIDDLACYPLAFEPGSQWHYSVGIVELRSARTRSARACLWSNRRPEPISDGQSLIASWHRSFLCRSHRHGRRCHAAIRHSFEGQ